MIYPVIVLKTGYGKYTSPPEKIYVSSTSVVFETLLQQPVSLHFIQKVNHVVFCIHG